MSAAKTEVLAMLAAGESQREVSRRTGISRKTLYRWAEDAPRPDAAPRRHFIIPDTQVKAGDPTDHMDWIGKAIRHYKPDVVIHLGDHWDFPSLSKYASAAEREGARIAGDIKAGNDALRRLHKAMGNFNGRKVILRGNHEDRLARFLRENPQLEGSLGFNQFCDAELGWEIVPYVGASPGQVVIDGVTYAHYFPNPSTSKPIGGTIANRIAKIGTTFVQGHVQGLMRGDVPLATGKTSRGIVAGSCYLHDEGYRGICNKEDRCVIVLNGLNQGRFLEMVVDLDYLCRKYEHMSVARYLREHYKNAEQRFTLARAA